MYYIALNGPFKNAGRINIVDWRIWNGRLYVQRHIDGGLSFAGYIGVHVRLYFW